MPRMLMGLNRTETRRELWLEAVAATCTAREITSGR